MKEIAKKSMEDYFIRYDHQIKDRGKTSIWDSVLSVDIYKIRSSPISSNSRTENIKYSESLCTIESSSTQFFLFPNLYLPPKLLHVTHLNVTEVTKKIFCIDVHLPIPASILQFQFTMEITSQYLSNFAWSCELSHTGFSLQ